MSGPQYYLYFHPPENSGVDAAVAAAGAAEKRWKCGQRTALQPTQELLRCHNPRAAQQSIVAFCVF